jgi:WD40 repeat protein
VQRAGVLLGLAAVMGMFELRARLAQQDERTAKEVAEATAITAEVEQGRAALLHDDMVDAQKHLAEADRRGDHSPATSFMLARASQPMRSELARFDATNGRMWSASWSRDGARVVITDDSAAQIWAVDAHQLVATLPHGDTVFQAVFSHDGAAVITAGNDGTVRLWRAQDGALIRTLSVRRAVATPPHYGIAEMSPDDRLVAAIDVAGAVVHVWDAGTGAVLAVLPGKGTDWPSLAFSSDGRWLATGGGDDVQVFDARSWTRATTIAGPRIRTIAWDPSGSRLMTGSAAGDASIWAVPSGARIHHLREVGEPVDAVAWSADARLVALAGRNGDEQVFDTTTGQLASQSNQLHDKMLAIEFDRSSQLVVAAGVSGAVAISDAATGMPVSLLEGPTKLVRTAHFDPSSRRVLGASWDGTARIWDASSPYLRWHAPAISDDCGVVISLEPDQRVAAVPCRDRATRVWDTTRNTLLAELPAMTAPGHGLELVLPAVSSAGDMAAIARGDAVELYELPGGRLLRTVHHGAAVSALAFSTDGHDLVSGAVDGSLLLTRDDSEPLSLPAAPRGIDAVAMLADGRALAADARGRVRVIAVGRGNVLAELESTARIALLRPSPASNRLVGVFQESATAPPILWDLTSYRTVAQLKGHVGHVFDARWIAGDRILTAGGDGSARMWDSSGAKLVEYSGSTRFLAGAALSPDGNFVVGGGADGRLRFWDAVTGRALWTTPAHIGTLVSIRFEGEDIVTRGVGGDVSRWRLPPKQ